MNRIFFALIAVSFMFGAYRQITWEPPPAPPPVEVTLPDVPGLDHPDPVVAEMARTLAVRTAPEPPPAPEAAKPPMTEIQDAILSSAKLAVNLLIGLVGAMAFFLGLMKVAEDGGLLNIIAKLIRPLMVRLFPGVPPDHPAMAAMILNLSANALGLGNAATPFGIKAMAELDSLNRHKGTATNAMALFLAINTSSVTLLPTGVIVWRETLGSTRAADIVPTTLFATLFSTSCAVLACALYSRWVATPEEITPPEDVVELEPYESSGDDGAYPGWVTALALTSLVAMIPVTVLYGRVIAPWIIPTLAMGMISFGFARGVPVYESFVKGAREGWDLAIRITPFLVAILCAVGMFRASGALDVLVGGIDPITSRLGMPAEALPMALLRPLSGSGAMGIMASILSDPATGPDTYTGFLVSTLNGSTETTFYVLAVYYGSINIQRYRHTLVAALTADFAGVVGAVTAVSLYFAYNG